MRLLDIVSPVWIPATKTVLDSLSQPSPVSVSCLWLKPAGVEYAFIPVVHYLSGWYDGLLDPTTCLFTTCFISGTYAGTPPWVSQTRSEPSTLFANCHLRNPPFPNGIFIRKGRDIPPPLSQKPAITRFPVRCGQ